MSDNLDSGLFINYALSLLLRKIIVPSDYHSQVRAVKELQEDDVSGLIDSLTDFSVNSASVDFSIETGNETFTQVLKQWLNQINKGYNGKIPIGIQPLSEEYFKERWKYSSFPILKIAEWGNIGKILVPTKMFFVDGGSIYTEDKNEDDENLKLINYDYYLGQKKLPSQKLDRNVIFSRASGRWFDEYPTPYLIRRGIYHNWKIIQSLKDKETQILDQIIPYLLLVQKGSEALAVQKDITYSEPELKAVIKEFQILMDELKSTNLDGKQIKSPIRATQFDETIKHLIPDLSDIFDLKLFASAERNILSGFGFIDVIEGVSTSRRESILNPKGFIEETKKGVKDFKQILKQLMFLIIEKNSSHIKYLNSNTQFYINASPVKAFMTEEFKDKIRQLYDRGRVSSQTAVELIAEVDFETEIHRREKEAERNIDKTLYPPVTKNQEGQGIDFPNDIDEENIPDDKKGIEKENYDIGKDEAIVKCPDCGNIFDMLAETETHMGAVSCPKCSETVTQKDLLNAKKELVGAPYNTIKELPSSITNNMNTTLQRVFMKVFNKVFDNYKDETRAFKVTWSVIKKIAKKNKSGKWVKKTKLTKATIEENIKNLQQ